MGKDEEAGKMYERVLAKRSDHPIAVCVCVCVSMKRRQEGCTRFGSVRNLIMLFLCVGSSESVLKCRYVI